VSGHYVLPAQFEPFRSRYRHIYHEPKCRLEAFEVALRPSGQPNVPTFRFSECAYLDYLASGEHLDEPLPDRPDRSLRELFAPRLDCWNLSASRLTNICGVGAFVVTSDEMVIVARHTSNVDVWGEVWSYTASGTMNWMPVVNPFNDVCRECFEEVGHAIDPENLVLFGYGIDSTKLYHQFSFVEHSGMSSERFLARARHAQDFVAEVEDLVAVPLELGAAVEFWRDREWEPAAEAGFLTLLAKRFGLAAVERSIDPTFVRARTDEETRAIWNHRGSRSANLAVMSARYPYGQLDAESEAYVDAVLAFLGTDVDGLDVVDVGCGIGRLTEPLVARSGRLTAVDISAVMLKRTRERLGARARDVALHNTKLQDYAPASPHDIAICSLVLIHCIGDEDFRAAVRAIAASARSVFVFEHVSGGVQVSPSTRVRPEPEVVGAFEAQGLRMARRTDYELFDDHIAFLKFTR
jgi:2-polyprenyl-3-methyl-5-hydroxy-6-metoxy-1,4-benzoquinol methylase